MANNNFDIEDLLGLKDKTITIDLDVKPKKGTLEYDIYKGLGKSAEDYIREKAEESAKKEEFMRLFRACFKEIIEEFQYDPMQRIAVNCAGCKFANRVDLGYGKCQTIRSETNGYRK